MNSRATWCGRHFALHGRESEVLWTSVAGGFQLEEG